MASRTDKQTWETFLRQPDDLRMLQEGAEVPLVIRDLSPGRRKYTMKHVVAALSRDPRAMASLDELRVRTVVGVLLPEVWGMRIVRELPVELPGTPYRHFFESLRSAASKEIEGVPSTQR
jgi:hypothetical protein